MRGEPANRLGKIWVGIGLDPFPLDAIQDRLQSVVRP